MDSTIQKWRTLVDRLTYYTSSRKIKWKDSADSGVYITRISGAQISLHESQSDKHWDEMIYYIRIYNGSGEVVDAFSDEDIASDDVNYFKIMKNLYRSIVRMNNGSEDVLDGILKELPDPDEIPF